jgi:hypothetical protein
MLNNMLSYIAYYQNFNKKKNKNRIKRGLQILFFKKKKSYIYT